MISPARRNKNDYVNLRVISLSLAALMAPRRDEQSGGPPIMYGDAAVKNAGV